VDFAAAHQRGLRGGVERGEFVGDGRGFRFLSDRDFRQT
jgi:hypothetical protein